MILPGETEAGTAGTQPCRGISRWAHRDDERGREDSFLRRPISIGSKDPYDELTESATCPKSVSRQ